MKGLGLNLKRMEAVMYEVDFAMYEATMQQDGGLGEGGGGGGYDPGAGGDPGGWTYPEGAETMVISNIGIDEYGEEVLEWDTMIRLPGESRWIDYLDWKASFDPTDPTTLDQWVIGETIDKGEYTLLVTQRIVIVNGQEVAKADLFIKETGGGGGYVRLNEWEDADDKLEAVKKLKNAG
jgi:hypothetical protein